MNQQFSFATRRRALKRHRMLRNMTDEERQEWYESECLKLIQNSGDKALERQLTKAKIDKELVQRKHPAARKSYIIGSLMDLNRRFQEASEVLRGSLKGLCDKDGDKE